MPADRARLFRETAAALKLPQDAGEAGSAVYDPFNQQRLTAVASLSAEDVSVAVGAAAKAFPDWAARPAKERSAILRRWMALLTEHTEDLARLIVFEQGKPLDQARREVVGAVAYAGWYAEEAKRAYGDLIPSPSASTRILVAKKPVGPVAMLTPWNFPLTMVVRKSAPALAAGCTVVVKPSEHTPLSALAAQHLAREAGFPDGVFNVVTGDPATIGSVLSTDRRVQKLSFTGSTRVGKLLYAQAADTVKGLSLELGGNAPFLVFDDADLDRAVAGIMASKFRNGGQTCVSANRILLQCSIHDDVVARLAEKVSALKVGDGFDPDSDFGPVIHQGSVDRIADLGRDALTAGGTLMAGGGEAVGLLVPPTLISGLDRSVRAFSEEIFGPLAPVFSFETEEEAISLANDSLVGLSAYLHTSDLSRAWRMSERLEVGVLGVNEGTTSNEMAPFGGVKESGQGREGGHQGLEDYLETQYRLIGL